MVQIPLRAVINGGLFGGVLGFGIYLARSGDWIWAIFQFFLAFICLAADYRIPQMVRRRLEYRRNRSTGIDDPPKH